MLMRKMRLFLLSAGLRRQSPLTLMTSCLSICLILVLLKFSFHNDQRVVIAVVEEHHEVLPYWFNAANTGVIPQSGLTLIHVDGHSDESIPNYIAGMPFFRYPRDEEEVEMLMQKNDVFIQAAVMSGLISKVIWIYPSWDKSQSENDLEVDINIGQVNVKEKSVRETRLCNCVKNHNVEDEDLRCFFLNFAGLQPNQDPEFDIEPKKCKLSKMYTSIHVKDVIALEKLATGGELIAKEEDVILDIDEDFFGCESGIIRMNEAGVPTENLMVINDKLGALFCPHFINHEPAADVLFKDTVQILIQRCEWKANFNKCEATFDDVMATTTPKLMETFQKYPSLFCATNDGVLVNSWKALVAALYRTSYLKLRAYLEMGVCLNTSPATFGFLDEEEGGIQLCHGVNSPNNTVNFLHSPSEREITHRQHILKDILRQIDAISRPKLVTIARSVRDGFTPRNLSSLIEESVLKALAPSDIDSEFRVVYDRNLLAGAPGWKARYKPLIVMATDDMNLIESSIFSAQLVGE
ncbi:hypothetical protein CAPTEDRAFT_215860 [Capitella teleta]|uniref:Uncharacterized protein n=1 Tax=Capitella teleta TaxID=283909 RepID=R7UDG8_CAPTE|nr:hypothetical protein CAPTEDRAFT_215860 [Capitella teleta]|eukprot:ELU01312.1 hypothetical protein CAPTEDRAFT_215860 [Capitella teleta]